MKCKNTSDRSYTGKENTPLGKGYSASVEKEGKRMRGKDGNMYMVKKYRNGKRWVRVASGSRRDMSPRMKFMKFFQRKPYKISETITLTPVESLDMGGDEQEKIGDSLTIYPDRVGIPVMVIALFRYRDTICNVSASISVYKITPYDQSHEEKLMEHGYLSEDYTPYTDIFWDGKKPKDNKNCKKSLDILVERMNDKEIIGTVEKRVYATLVGSYVKKDIPMIPFHRNSNRRHYNDGYTVPDVYGAIKNSDL